MKWPTKIRTSGCLISCFAVSATAFAASTTEGIVISREMKLTKALTLNNVDAVGQFFSESVIYVATDGRVQNKAAFIEELKAINFIRADMSELKVIEYGDMAIATLMLNATIADEGGTNTDVSFRTLHTWRKLSTGASVCVAISAVPNVS